MVFNDFGFSCVLFGVAGAAFRKVVHKYMFQILTNVADFSVFPCHNIKLNFNDQLKRNIL